MAGADPQEDEIDDIGTGLDGRIVTFYSYKGGTGRSMALANVAWLLALRGKRVLVMDWDLEAPGIRRFFHPFLSDPALVETDGVLEYVGGLASLAAHQPKDTDWTKMPEAFFDEHANILSYARPLTFPDFPEGGQLDFIPAGRQDRTYSERLSLFQFVTFYERLGGRRFMEASKKWLRAEYDYVLLDSRTGVSDTSGICTVQMPDILVICLTLNEQNVRGAAGIAADVRAQRKADEDEGRFWIYPVPTRVEMSEQDRKNLALEGVQRTFNTYLGRMTPAQKVDYWLQIQVVYLPYYAFEEIPVVFGNPPKEQFSMLVSTRQLAEYLTGGKITGEIASLSEVRRKEHLARFLRKLDDPAVTAKNLLEKHARESDALRRLILRFVTPGSGTVPDSLRPISLEEVGPAEIPLLSDFRDARLIAQDDDATPPVLRLAPDELIRTWDDCAIGSSRNARFWIGARRWRARRKDGETIRPARAGYSGMKRSTRQSGGARRGRPISGKPLLSGRVRDRPTCQPSNHLGQQLGTRVGNHHFVDQHALLAHHLRAGIHGGLNGGHIAGHGHERLAAERHREANLDQLDVGGLHRGVRAFDQRSHRERFHDAQRLHFLHLRDAADGGEYGFVQVRNHERIDHRKVARAGARRNRRLHRRYVAPDHHHVLARADGARQDQLYVGRLQHGIARLESRGDAGQFDQSE
jgi:hypothetical protein